MSRITISIAAFQWEAQRGYMHSMIRNASAYTIINKGARDGDERGSGG
jgi:hypothetical protein